MPARYQQKHVVHPTTLDSIFQAAYPSLPDGALKILVLPRSIKTMFISGDVSTQEGHQFQSISKLTRADRRGFVASLTTVDKDNGALRPRIQIQGLFLQALKTMNENKSSFQDAKTHFTTRWLPDFSIMEPQVIAKCLTFESEPSEVMMHQKLQRAAFHFIHDTLAALSEEDVNRMEWYHKELYQWMISQDLNAAANILDPQSATWGHTTEDSKRLLFDDIASQSTDGRMVCRVGKALLPILRKETTALEVMLQDKLLYEYYEKALRYSRSYTQVASLVRMFAAKYPKARVLEIGAGTGGCTKHVLEALGTRDSWNGMQFSHFDFTDVSSGFFDMARQKFQDWGDMVAYKKLDIEEDPALQSFEVGTYDLIIASGVLHATKVMQQTMLNVRKLLKPGGRLVLVETTKDTIDLHMIFGTLPGWWSSEEIERKQSPNLNIDSWQRLLLRTGFSGIDVEVGDCEEPNACASVMMSTALEESSFRIPVSIVFARSLPPAPWLEKLVGAIKTITTLTPTVKSSCGIPEEDEICLFFDDESNPILKEVETFEFEAIRKLLTQANGILWVTKGGAMTGAQPESALCFGLLRTLRLEAQGKRYATLDLDPGNSFWTDSAIRHVVNIFKSTFDSRREIEDVDFEYAERDSVLHIPRVVESQNGSTAALTAWEDLMAQNNRLGGSGRNVFLDLATVGMLDSLHFRDDTSGDQTLPSDFVEIQPKAFGVNFRDVMIAIGQLDDGGHIGIECSGIITGIGAEASSYSLRIGDRVCAVGGHWSTSVRVPWTSVARIPDEMTFEEAASVPTVFLTVYHAFYDVANLKSGETVLIHSGTGGIGQAAIMLAKHIGAVIFVTAGSQEKRDFIHETYGIDHDHIFSSRDSSFVSGIMHTTQGKGVDVILNSLAGPLLQASWNCIARFGRFLEIGKRDIHSAKLLDMEPMRRAASFSAVDLVQIVKYRGHIVTKDLAEVLHLMKQGVLQPVKPIRIFPVQQIEQAFRTMQMGKHMGKLVIKPNPGDLVKFIPQRSLTTALSADYSYLIVGSINGIGRSIAQWMTQNGAQNLVLLSRSAESSGNNAAITELKRAGFRIFIRNCDVANRGDLERVLGECARTMPPIRGVIQAAMVLQDSVFEMMSLNDWKAATRPKVQATWSLHHCLPKLDFFIILSSLLGVIGNPSQGNYAAGGAFQDAFARYRITQNLPAVSIDLGAVGSVGYVAETSGVAERLEKAGLREIGIDEVLRTINWAVKNPKGIDNTGQIVTGVFPFDETMNVAWRHDRRFSALRSPALSNDHTATTHKRSTHTLKDTLGRGTSWIEAVKLITQAIVEKVASIFTLPSSEILASEPLSKYGVDSLVAVELRNWLLMAAQSEVSIFDVLHSSSVSVLAETVSVKSRYVKSAGIHPPV